MSHCHTCQVHHFAFQSLFPNTVRFKPQKLIQEAFVKNGHVGNNKVKPTQKAITSAAKHIYLKMGTFRKPLTLALLKLKLKCPSSSYSKRKAKYKRNANVDSEHVKKRTKCKRNGPNVTQIQCLARGSQRAKQRTTLYFETLEEAAARVGKRKRQEDPRVRKKKRHSPPSHQVNFDKENLLKEVTNMKEGHKVRSLEYNINSEVPYIYHKYNNTM